MIDLLLSLALLAGDSAATGAVAQGGARLEVELPPPTGAAAGPSVRGVRVIADAKMRDLLRNGFPARLHFRVELWSTGGLFNTLEGNAQWDVVVRYDPLARTFGVARLVGDRLETLGEYDDFADAVAAAERPYRVPLVPKKAGERYYYNVVLDVETLSLGDLDEVEQWLRGELKPAVRGQRNPGTALTRGVRTLVVRLLGGEKRHFERRSATFRA